MLICKQHIFLEIDLSILVALLIYMYTIELYDFTCVISFLRKIFDLYV